MRFGLDEKTIELINQIFAKYPQIEKVILYGSRAKGNCKRGSDIDLTIIGAELDLGIINMVSNDLDDLLLPYMFDISVYGQIQNPDLIDHIERIGRVLYQKDAPDAGNFTLKQDENQKDS